MTASTRPHREGGLFAIFGDPMALADAARDRGATALAAKLYARIGPLDHRHFSATVQRANMLKDSGRFDDAEAAYFKARGMAPHNADVHLQLGHLYKLRGHEDRALICYEAADRLDPGRGEARREATTLRLNRDHAAAAPDGVEAP